MNHTNLQRLIDDGWQASIHGLWTIDDAPIAEAKIAEILKETHGKATHILALQRWDNFKGAWYIITSETDHQLAEKLVLEAKNIIGYKIRVTCRASTVNFEVDEKKLSECISEATSEYAKIDLNDKMIYAIIDIEGDDKSLGSKKLNQLESALLSISLKNKIHIEMSHISWGPRFAGQPFATWSGPPHVSPNCISKEDVKKISGMQGRPIFEIIQKFSRYYGQATWASRIIYGFSIIEELYGTSADHLLNETELAEVLTSIDQVKSVFTDDEKRTKIRDVIKNKNLLPAKNRNMRIANNVAAILDMSQDAAYQHVRDLSRMRGKMAHTAFVHEDELKDHCTFIENAINAYIKSVGPD